MWDSDCFCETLFIDCDRKMTPLSFLIAWLKVGIEIPEQILTIGYTSYSYYFLLFFFARIEEEKMK